MIASFIAFLLLGIPLMWIEWGIGRNGGRYREGHIPGMFAAIWRHPAAKHLGVVLVWWAVTGAIPILTRQGRRAAGGIVAPGSEPYVHLSRLLIVAIVVVFLVMIRQAWKRDGYDDRLGFAVVEDSPLGAPPQEVA